MAEPTILPKRFYKGGVTTTSAVLYPVPTGSIAILKALTICNKGGVVATFTLVVAGVNLIFNHTIKPYDTITIPFLDQVILSGENISGYAQTSAANLDIYISGKEVT